MMICVGNVRKLTKLSVSVSVKERVCFKTVQTSVFVCVSVPCQEFHLVKQWGWGELKVCKSQ